MMADSIDMVRAAVQLLMDCKKKRAAMNSPPARFLQAARPPSA